jgi:predicted RNase H-like nuclease (RuvC/YqgF family)
MIERLAAALGSKVYYPEVSLTNIEKEKIINDFEKEIKNSHQKDALAAGLKAFKNYHELFLKIEETLTKQHRKEIFEEVIEEFSEDETQNIIDAIKKVARKKKK